MTIRIFYKKKKTYLKYISLNIIHVINYLNKGFLNTSANFLCESNRAAQP